MRAARHVADIFMRLSFSRFTVFPIIGIIFVLFGAVTAKSETLFEALATAYVTNPTLKAARAALRSSDEGVPLAMAGWRPTVSLSTSVG